MDTPVLGGVKGALQQPFLATELITKSLDGVSGAVAGQAGTAGAAAYNAARAAALAEKGVGTMVNATA